MEPLARYLQEKGLSQVDFGNLIGTSGVAVCRWLSGLRRPTVRLAVAIEKATAGAVPVEAWATSPRRRRKRAA